MSVLRRLKEKAERCKHELRALAIAWRDPRTPWYARAVTILVVAYALSPIDLIPDFVPVLGYVDDLVLVPLGILLAIRLIPAQVMLESRARALAPGQQNRLPRSRVGAAIIVMLWLLGLAATALFAFRLFLPPT